MREIRRVEPNLSAIILPRGFEGEGCIVGCWVNIKLFLGKFKQIVATSSQSKISRRCYNANSLSYIIFIVFIFIIITPEYYFS